MTNSIIAIPLIAFWVAAIGLYTAGYCKGRIDARREPTRNWWEAKS